MIHSCTGDIKKLKIKKTYIFSMVITFFIAFLFISFIKASDNVSIMIPKIDGVSFFRTGDSTEVSGKRISFYGNELELEVHIDDQKYCLWDEEEVKSAFSVSGNLSLLKATSFESSGKWSLLIESDGKNSIENELNVRLKQRTDVVIEFPDVEGITYYEESNVNEVLGGGIKILKSGIEYKFKALIDTNIISIGDNSTGGSATADSATGGNFQILAGENDTITSKMSDQETGNQKTYEVTIKKVLYNAKVEPNEMITIDFTDIQGLSYYSDVDKTKEIRKGTSKMIMTGSAFTFFIELDDQVPLKQSESNNNEPELSFNIGNNKIATKKVEKRKYEVTLENIKFSGKLESDDLLSITFPSIKDVIFKDGFGDIEANTYRTVGKGSEAKFIANIKEGSSLLGKEDLEFTAGNNKVETSGTGESRTVKIKEVSESAEIEFNYNFIGFNNAPDYLIYSLMEGNEINGRTMVIKTNSNFEFLVKIDTTKVEIGSNVQTISVSAGENKKISVSNPFTSNNMFKVVIKNVTYDAEIEVPGIKQLDFMASDAIKDVEFFEVDLYGNASSEKITGVKNFIQGSNFNFAAKLPITNIKGTEHDIDFSFGHNDSVTIKKYYIGDKNGEEVKKEEEEAFVYYSVEVTVNDGGTLKVENGYTITFPDLGPGITMLYLTDTKADAGTNTGDNNNNKINPGQVILVGKNSYTFKISFTNKYNYDYTNPKIFAGNHEVEIVKEILSNEATTEGQEEYHCNVTVKSPKSDCTISIGKVNITFPDIDGVIFSNGTDPDKKILNGQTLEVVYGFILNVKSTVDKNKVPISDLTKFSAGGNSVETKRNSEDETFTLDIVCIEDATVSIGKLLTFPSIYDVKFYNDNGNTSDSKAILGNEIGGGTSKSVVSGSKFSFIVEVDSSIVKDTIDEMFILKTVGTADKKLNAKKISVKDGSEDRSYFRATLDAVQDDAQIVSNCLFTIDLPTLPSINYYKKIEDGKFKDPLVDKKITLFSKNISPAEPATFYVHFDDAVLYPADKLPEISKTSKSNMKIETTPVNNYTTVRVTEITSNSSINIEVEKKYIDIDMPEKHSYIDLLQYAKDEVEIKNKTEAKTNNVISDEKRYEDINGERIKVSYGSPISLRMSFKNNVDGYSNLYKTLTEKIKVKVYSTKGLENGSDVSSEGVLLETIDIKSLSADSSKFIEPGQIYESNTFYPTENSILIIEGIISDFYDVHMVSGDNVFQDSEIGKIEEVLKIFKIDAFTGEEIEVPYTNYKQAFVIKSISYGDSIKIKYSFTNGANDEGIKYDMSEITISQDPYEGDSGLLDKDSDGIYQPVIKSNTILSISGIKINIYKINIPAAPSVNVRYVLDEEGLPSDDDQWSTANKEISVYHGQKVSMKIDSNDAVKSYIKTVTAKDTYHDADPITIYNGQDGIAKEKTAIATIEGVPGDMDLSIVVSKKEYKLDFTKVQDKGDKIEYPNPTEIVIYNNKTNVAVNSGKVDSNVNVASSIAKDGEDFEFRFVLDYKYDRSDLTVAYKTLEEGDSDSGIMITPRDDIYTLKNVKKDGQIRIDGLKKNKYKLEFPQPSDEVNFHEIIKESDKSEREDVLATHGIQELEHGSNFSFIPKIQPGYALSGESVKANGEPISLINGRYELTNISNDIKITADPLDKINYNITFPNSIKGVTFVDSLGTSISSVKKEYGSSISFKVLIDPKYGQSEDTMSVYAIPSEITNWGDPSFDIVDSEAVKLKKDGASNYILQNIFRDTTIIVRDVSINKYFIDLPVDDRVAFIEVQKNQSDKSGYAEEGNKERRSAVSYGEDFVFSAKASEGYDISVMNLTAILASSGYEIPIEKMSNGYIIQNITDDITVKASQINISTYTVNLSGENMIFRKDINSTEEIDSMTIEHSIGEIEFTVSPKEGYIFIKDGISLTPPGGTGTGEAATGETGTGTGELDKGFEIEIPKLSSDGFLDGPVKVKNVKQDIKLEFSGVEVKNVVVALPTDTEGISFMKVDKENSTEDSVPSSKDVSEESPRYVQSDFEWESENSIPMSSDFRFYIRGNYGYDLTNISVSTGPGSYLSPIDGIYTIPNVTENMSVEVSGVGYSIYTVKLRGDNMNFYESDELFPKSDFEVSYKGSFKFRVSPNTGYEINVKNLKFSVNDEDNESSKNSINISEPDSNGIFTASSVNKNTVINVSEAKKEIYTISFPSDLIGAEVKKSGDIKIDGIEKVEYLGSLSFEIVPNKGYNIDSTVININPAGNGTIRGANGGYIIEAVTGNIDVSIDGINANDYSVKYKGIGAEFYSTDGSKVTSGTTKFGGNFTFSIKAQEGYDLNKGYKLSILNESGDSVTISASLEDKSGELKDGTQITETDRYTYTVSNVQGSIVVLIESVGKNEYNISLPTSVKGIKFFEGPKEGGVKNEISEGKVIHNGDFTFTIESKEGYDISNIRVTANLVPIELINGQYTIENVTSDILIEVTGVVSTKVYVNLKYISGVVFKDTNDNILSTLEKIWVDNGSSFSFKISLDDSYSQSKDNIEVSIDSSSFSSSEDPDSTNSSLPQLSYNRGIYTISNITKDITVIVSNAELNSYNIKLSESNGIKYMDEYGIKEINGTQIVNYGKDFRFMVNPSEGFTLSDIEVSVKGGNDERIQLSPVDGVYTIPNITSDYTVVVENAKKENYTVEIRISEGAALLDKGGNSLSNNLTVKHGDSLSFRLSLDTAYNKSSPLVTVKGRSDPINPENNIYTVRNITGNTIVEVSNVKKNTYKVNFKGTEGVIYKTEKNKVFAGQLEIEYGGTLTFKVALKDPYDASQFTVLLDGDKTLGANGGMYQIVSVGSDCEVSVKYVTKNTEESVIEMISALPDQISNNEDASKVVNVTRAYNDLPDDNKNLVTNISKLRILQTDTVDIHHESNGVEVTGIDWNIKVNVVPLDGDSKSVERLNEKMERKTVISHYQISLIDSLTGKKYKVPEGQTVSVVLPLDMPKGYMNTVIVHEKESGNIEYLDVLISNGYAKFSTSSFSVFGIAAKKIPNYVEDVTEVTVSLAGLTQNEEETKKQILGQELSSILDDDSDTNIQSNTSSNSNTSNKVGDASEGKFVDKALDWILNNEFLITSAIIAIFATWIFIVLFRNDKKKQV